MDALLRRLHNFILPLVRGQDRVCVCACGRQQANRVIPYHGAETTMASRGNYVVNDIMTRQELDVITGLLMGLCISWILLWLDGVWCSGLKYWRENQMNSTCFWSRMLKFRSMKNVCRCLHAKHRGLQAEQGGHETSCVPSC